MKKQAVAVSLYSEGLSGTFNTLGRKFGMSESLLVIKACCLQSAGKPRMLSLKADLEMSGR